MNTRPNPTNVKPAPRTTAQKPSARPAAPSKPTHDPVALARTLAQLNALEPIIGRMLDDAEEFQTRLKEIDLSQIHPGFRDPLIRQIELFGWSQHLSTQIFYRNLEQLTEAAQPYPEKPNAVKPQARPLRKPVAPTGLDADLVDIPG